jgi:hypothetical protein
MLDRPSPTRSNSLPQSSLADVLVEAQSGPGRRRIGLAPQVGVTGVGFDEVEHELEGWRENREVMSEGEERRGSKSERTSESVEQTDDDGMGILGKDNREGEGELARRGEMTPGDEVNGHVKDGTSVTTRTPGRVEWLFEAEADVLVDPAKEGVGRERISVMLGLECNIIREGER